MANVRFTFDGGFASAVRRLATNVAQAAVAAASKLAQGFLTQATWTSSGQDPGHPGITLTTEMTTYDNMPAGVVQATGPAVEFEFGTAPHRIEPRHPAEALYWEGADHPVAYVDHPGTPPRPFLRAALQQLPQSMTPGEVPPV